MEKMVNEVVNSVFGTLPLEVYRDFNHGFSLKQNAHDDLQMELRAEFFWDGKFRISYLGSNLRRTILHHEYWNGTDFERLPSGGPFVTKQALTQDNMKEWFLRQFGFAATSSAKVEEAVGMENVVQDVLRRLPNHLTGVNSREYELCVSVSQFKGKLLYDIYYVDLKSGDHIWFDEEDDPIQFNDQKELETKLDRFKKLYRLTDKGPVHEAHL